MKRIVSARFPHVIRGKRACCILLISERLGDRCHELDLALPSAWTPPSEYPVWNPGALPRDDGLLE